MDVSQEGVEIGYKMEEVSADVSQAGVEVGYRIEEVIADVSFLGVEIGSIRSGRKYNVQHI